MNISEPIEHTTCIV